MPDGQEIGRYLTEAMGLCWHEFDTNGNGCTSCQLPLDYEMGVEHYHIDFVGEWRAFGLLWEWAIKQEWWYEFWYGVGRVGDRRASKSPMDLWAEHINPEKFSRAIYDFLKGRK